jgi:hypothetical protein
LLACVLSLNPPSKYIRYQSAVLFLSFTMPASHAALLLLLALSMQQALAAPLISPGSESREHPQHGETVAKFHLVANTDVTKRVSSKGLMCASSALHCFAVVVILTPSGLFFLSVANFPAARMDLIKKCGLYKSRMDWMFLVAAKLPAKTRPSARRRAR